MSAADGPVRIGEAESSSLSTLTVLVDNQELIALHGDMEIIFRYASIFCAAAAKLLPEEILKITSKIEYSDLPDDEHIIRSPKELLSGEKGTCYDVVELERMLFKGYKFKTFFAYAGLPVNDNRTHTFLVFENGGKWYWFESTWVTNRGVHGPFENIKRAVAMVRKQLEKDWKQKCDVIEYGPIDYSGMTLNDYGEEIVKKFYGG
jgi:hypothetical protein